MTLQNTVHYRKYTKETPLTEEYISKIGQFLVDALGAFGDPKIDIIRSLRYAVEQIPSFGGFIYVAYVGEEEKIGGVVVVNCTGMKGYIPENNVTYLAVDAQLRGRGVGKKLLQLAVNQAQGNLSLHVEPHNPAIALYEKIGFRHKYNEMRLWKEKTEANGWKMDEEL